MRTIRLKQLMKDALETLPKPYTEDVIEDVFVAIEQNPKWRKEYDDLKYHLGKGPLNAWGGFWITHCTGRVPGEQVSASRSALIEAYSKLSPGPKNANKKVKEPEALKIMSEYFYANREALPADIRAQRNLIIELLKEGFPPADAFSKALEKPAMAR